MKKLSLRLDDLRIESFTTTRARTEKGTVFGEQCTCPTACTCPGCPTCEGSCEGSCDASCNGTCASCDATCGASCVGTCGFQETCFQGCTQTNLYSVCNGMDCM